MPAENKTNLAKTPLFLTNTSSDHGSFYSCLASQSADIKTAERFFTRSAARILCAVYRIRIGKFFVSVINPYCCKRVGVAAVIYGFEFIATVKRAGVNMR